MCFSFEMYFKGNISQKLVTSKVCNTYPIQESLIQELIRQKNLASDQILLTPGIDGAIRSFFEIAVSRTSFRIPSVRLNRRGRWVKLSLKSVSIQYVNNGIDLKNANPDSAPFSGSRK